MSTQESVNKLTSHVMKDMLQNQYLMESLTNKLNEKITEIEELNIKLAKANSKKDDFMSIATHELKSPIHPILGFAELVKKGIITQDEAWNGVVEMATQLQNLMGVILDANHIDRDSLKLSLMKVDVKELINQKITISKSSPDCNVPILCELEGDFVIIADQVRLGEVFQNLLNNSIKFTKRGTIKVSGSIHKENNEIILRFSDSGTGIPEEIQSDIFEKFITKNLDSQKPGSGLGLFVCKGIIEGHGGKIYANNNDSGGATFTIKLPISHYSKNE